MAEIEGEPIKITMDDIEAGMQAFVDAGATDLRVGVAFQNEHATRAALAEWIAG